MHFFVSVESIRFEGNGDGLVWVAETYFACNTTKEQIIAAIQKAAKHAQRDVHVLKYLENLPSRKNNSELLTEAEKMYAAGKWYFLTIYHIPLESFMFSTKGPPENAHIVEKIWV